MAASPLTVQVISKRLEQLIGRLPAYVQTGMRNAAGRGAQKFLAHHKRVALSAKSQGSSGPLVSSESDKSFIKKRKYEVTGDSLSNLQVDMRIVSTPAVQHEEGRTINAKGGKYLPVPMKAGKDSRGRTTKKAYELLRKFWHAAQAESAGFVLGSSKGKRRRFRKFTGLSLYELPDGRKFLILIRKTKAKELWTFYFSLQKQVKLKPRFLFYKTWAEFKPKFFQEFARSLPFAIRAAKAAGGGV